MLWEPAIYEHKAALINKPPAEVAYSVDLLTRSILCEYETYQADLLTVGIDVYNIEPEACGARVEATDDTSCPEIAVPPYNLEKLPEKLLLPPIPESGRFQLILDTGRTVKAALPDKCEVRIAVSGPATIASKLVGMEPLVLGLALSQPAATVLLDFCSQLAANWCRVLCESGLTPIIFDSAAAPPMFSPGMYKEHLFPRHHSLMHLLETLGQTSRPLIIGGNTVPLVDQLAQTGATMLICDYGANAADFAQNLPFRKEPAIRRNVNPALLMPESTASLTELAQNYAVDLAKFANPVAGTGILPYNFEAARYHEFKSLVESVL